jgi:peptide/nickel transport system permease protein
MTTHPPIAERASETALFTGRPPDTLTSRAWKRFRRHKLALIGSTVLGSIVFLAIFGPMLSPYSQNAVIAGSRNQPPSLQHWLGTNDYGWDLLTRLMYGGRVSLAVGLVAQVVAISIGTLLGSLAGYMGGVIDLAIVRFTEAVQTFPTFMMILIVVAIFGGSMINIMLVIGLFGWTGVMRYVRGQVLTLREMPFIEAARCLGASQRRILSLHIVPNVVPYLIVFATGGVAGAILTEAGLSFLGVGIQPPNASWGEALISAQNLYVLKNYPWQWLSPGLTIMITVISINFMGDALRDALDPKSVI